MTKNNHARRGSVQVEYVLLVSLVGSVVMVGWEFPDALGRFFWNAGANMQTSAEGVASVADMPISGDGWSWGDPGTDVGDPAAAAAAAAAGDPDTQPGTTPTTTVDGTAQNNDNSPSGGDPWTAPAPITTMPSAPVDPNASTTGNSAADDGSAADDAGGSTGATDPWGNDGGTTPPPTDSTGGTTSTPPPATTGGDVVPPDSSGPGTPTNTSSPVPPDGTSGAPSGGTPTPPWGGTGGTPTDSTGGGSDTPPPAGTTTTPPDGTSSTGGTTTTTTPPATTPTDTSPPPPATTSSSGGTTTTTTPPSTTPTDTSNHCNQGVGNGAEGCDPGNSDHGNPANSNDENGGTPGAPGASSTPTPTPAPPPATTSSTGTSTTTTDTFTVVPSGAITYTTVAPKITVLGSAITYGVNGAQVPVKLQMVINGVTTTIFSGTGSQVTSASVAQLAAVAGSATTVNFIATSYNANGSVLYTQSTSVSSKMVIPLRNGDYVPNYTPYGQQPSIKSFLSSVIDPVTKKVTIGANEVLYLVELGTNDTKSAAADFQDLVFKATFTAGTATTVATSTTTTGTSTTTTYTVKRNGNNGHH